MVGVCYCFETGIWDWVIDLWIFCCWVWVNGKLGCEWIGRGVRVRWSFLCDWVIKFRVSLVVY